MDAPTLPSFSLSSRKGGNSIGYDQLQMEVNEVEFSASLVKKVMNKMNVTVTCADADLC